MRTSITGFWGKTRTDPVTGKVVAWLPLEHHCIDVACVFRALCELPGIRRALEQAAGQPLSEVQFDRLAVLALLHDFGKCNRGFQAKADPKARFTAGHVRETALLLYHPDWSDKLAQALDFASLAAWFEAPEAALAFLIAAVSHHGQPAFRHEIADTDTLDTLVRLWRPDADLDPFAGIAALAAAARHAFPAAFGPEAEPIPARTELQHRFAGLLMLADWLGSHREAFFPFEHEGDRADWARQRARQALRAVGLDIDAARVALAGAPPPFERAFGFSPRPLQAQLYRADLPPLLIAESDTGSGKTEAAFGHFLALFAAGRVDSLYFALPTRVAARELYARLQRDMQRVFGERCPPVLLAVPGYAQVDGEPPGLLPEATRLWQDDAGLRRHERTWAAERPKRFLAAPIAVGTVDQALLAVMTVPHAHLRSACLDRALLVVDEVHSSDVYLRALLRRLLDHHLGIGGRALLLSATLGADARAELSAPPTRHHFAPPLAETEETPYPALSGPGLAPIHLPDPERKPKTVHLEPLAAWADPAALLPRLRAAIEAGRRVLVVLNTVGRAIALARAAEADPVLAAALFDCAGVRCPHHGRFARTDRELLDRAVSERLGKDSADGALLLIGTQTLEQSLDIDADWLISDLCPIDVLLQRIGRLHRHDRGPRPPPVCTVLVPECDDLAALLDARGKPRGPTAGLGSVYPDVRIVQLTRALIGAGRDIEIPRDNRALVEAATHPERLVTLEGPVWQAHVQSLFGADYAKTQAAHATFIPQAPFGEFEFPNGLEERLATRLGLDDRRLPLGRSVTSPFGRPLDEIAIPGHLAKGIAAEAAESIEEIPDGLLVRYGGATFLYSRFGLEHIDGFEPAR